jgi:hypothetical protein
MFFWISCRRDYHRFPVKFCRKSVEVRICHKAQISYSRFGQMQYVSVTRTPPGALGLGDGFAHPFAGSCKTCLLAQLNLPAPRNSWLWPKRWLEKLKLQEQSWQTSLRCDAILSKSTTTTAKPSFWGKSGFPTDASSAAMTNRPRQTFRFPTLAICSFPRSISTKARPA